MKLVSEAEWATLTADRDALRREVIEAEGELDAIRSACRCNCHEEWSEAMNLKAHANCGECAAALLDEADELARIEREMWNSKLVEAEAERDAADERARLSGLEAHDLGNRLGKAEGACKRLREERDDLQAALAMVLHLEPGFWILVKKELRRRREGRSL